MNATENYEVKLNWASAWHPSQYKPVRKAMDVIKASHPAIAAQIFAEDNGILLGSILVRNYGSYDIGSQVVVRPS